MKNILILGLLMAFAVGQVQAAIPTTAEGWYTPEGGFVTLYKSAEWAQGGKQFKCLVSDDGVEWGADKPDNKAIVVALEKALKAELVNCQQNEEIEMAPNELELLNQNTVFIKLADKIATVVQLDDGEPKPLNNRRYCPAAKDMLENQQRRYHSACTAFSLATFAEFDMARRGRSIVPVDAYKIHDLALERRPAGINGDGARTVDCFDAYLDDMGARTDGIEAARFSVFGSSANADNVRKLTKKLISHFGGFIASLDTTAEWLLLAKKLHPACKEMNHPTDTINGTKVTISGDGHDIGGGAHCVLAYGYDDDGVLIENVWGRNWGDDGHARITWDEWGREFIAANLFAEIDELRNDLPCPVMTLCKTYRLGNGRRRPRKHCDGNGTNLQKPSL